MATRCRKASGTIASPTRFSIATATDALRWYFFANQPPWTTIRYSERAIKESIPEFLLKLWNVWQLLRDLRQHRRLRPGGGAVRRRRANFGAERSFLSGRTIARPESRSELGSLGAERTAPHGGGRDEPYGRLCPNFAACQRITEFVDALSGTGTVRRSPHRFWHEDKADRDSAADAYWTLYECLITTAKMVAPFVPFPSPSAVAKTWRRRRFTVA